MESSMLLSGVEVSLAAQEVDAGALYARLGQLTDRRARRGQRYTVALVVTIVLLAKLAGEKSVSGIAHWARLRQRWLRQALRLQRDSLPCANTSTNVCNQVDVAELNALLAAYFVPPLPALPAAAEAVAPPADAQRAQRPLVLDGKTLRGSDQRGEAARPARQVVTVYDVTHQGPLAQQARTSGQDERALAQQMLAGLDLRGCVVSADALHTQRDWVQQLCQQGGDYLLIAKGNQSLLRAQIAELFAAPLPRWLDERHARTSGKAHGRREVRHLRASTELAELLAPTWTGVAQVFQLDRRITRHGRTTHETVYGLTSLPPSVADAARLLALTRAHWFIENNVHWRRDVTLGEDACQVRARTAALVLAVLNTAVRALMDHLGVTNLAEKMRDFMAQPADALKLLLAKPDF